MSIPLLFKNNTFYAGKITNFILKARHNKIEVDLLLTYSRILFENKLIRLELN